MKEVKVKLTLDDDDAKKGVEDLTKETKKLDKEVGDVNESTNTLTDSLDKMTGGAITGFKGMVKGVKLLY